MNLVNTNALEYMRAVKRLNSAKSVLPPDMFMRMRVTVERDNHVIYFKRHEGVGCKPDIIGTVCLGDKENGFNDGKYHVDCWIKSSGHLGDYKKCMHNPFETEQEAVDWMMNHFGIEVVNAERMA